MSGWSIYFVAQTVDGEVSLRMTDEQAAELRDGLAWLMEDGDA